MTTKRTVARFSTTVCAGLLLTAVATTTVTTAAADVITIPVGQQGKDSTTARPERGSSQASVAAQFGQPLDKKAAVGKPPISSWRYANFTVYFEGDHVLHSVLNPPAHTPDTQPPSTDASTTAKP
ncbi:MAG TPA: hypothetical protein PLF22_08485 [Pseudomonadales bacterium]|nr:hypothetical protein [Pseudomonadales bacterium]